MKLSTFRATDPWCLIPHVRVLHWILLNQRRMVFLFTKEGISITRFAFCFQQVV